MTTQAQKTGRNLSLKVAIVESGKTQRRIAQACRIGEVRLSAIVHGRVEPTERERKALAKALGRDESDLFPMALAS